MTIKIKAPRAYMSEWTVNGKVMPCEISWYAEGSNKRAIRSSQHALGHFAVAERTQALADCRAQLSGH